MLTISCQTSREIRNSVTTTDIDLFWNAYDQIINETDTLKQVKLIDSLYIEKGSIGLQKIIDVRNYTAGEYVELINKYPKYWNSIRENTFKSKGLAKELNDGIEKLRDVYPDIKPAEIFFTVGAMRTNGTTQDSLVLIGSELAMADSSTDISEFEGRTKEWLETFFGSNPIDGLVLLNVHEYVHTQQNPIPDNLLYQVIYEGVAEFVSVKAMGVPSNTPAIEFGKRNPEVKQKFENEMFYERTYEWMWSNAPNEFDVRDLGYYIGYAIAENHYEQSGDKLPAVKDLIELDYSNSNEMDSLIDDTGFFSKPIAQLRQEFESKRPEVVGVEPFDNGKQDVSPGISQLTIQFSKPMAYQRNFDYGPLGEDAVVRFKEEIGYSDNDTRYTFEIEDLLPDKRYQIEIGPGFQDKDGVPLKPYLIDFKTGEK